MNCEKSGTSGTIFFVKKKNGKDKTQHLLFRRHCPKAWKRGGGKEGRDVPGTVGNCIELRVIGILKKRRGEKGKGGSIRPRARKEGVIAR